MWSPFVWVYDVCTAGIWGGGLKTMENEWEREDVGQIQARIATLDVSSGCARRSQSARTSHKVTMLQETTAALHVDLINKTGAFDP
jgi:hypothetical protein